MKRSFLILTLGMALCSGVVGGLAVMVIKNQKQVESSGENDVANTSNHSFAPKTSYPDFTYAAEQSVEAVVHVTTVYKQQRDPLSAIMEYYFGYRMPQQYERRQPAGMGSGVILTTDGYIVTNNHVIEKATEIQVALYDKRTFSARLIGTDPITDIAVLKIEAENLPYLPFGNSDSLRLGEWVLAIGNPYNLNSTITAGIVSAKGRKIPSSDGRYKIESFIQTDAAVNPGNSGGALINLRGELVGINTAIASPTGSFSGYSFAVPTGIVQKVVEEIIQFGSVEHAILGVAIADITNEIVQKLNLKTPNGALVTQAIYGGAAAKSGIREGDVIIKINGVNIKSSNAVQEQISRYRPNEQIEIIVERDGKEKYFNVVLQNTNYQK